MLAEAKLAGTDLKYRQCRWSLECFRAGGCWNPDAAGVALDVISTGIDVGTADCGAAIGASFGVGFEVDLPFDGDGAVALGWLRVEVRFRPLGRVLHRLLDTVAGVWSELGGR